MIVWATDKLRDNLPRLGWKTPAGTVTASTAASGYGAALAFNGDTFDAWKPTAVQAWLRIDFDAAQDVDYIAIGAHTAGESGATLTPQYWTGSAWVTFPGCAFSPANDDAIMWLVSKVNTLRIRVLVDTAICEIGVMKCGLVTQFPVNRHADYLGDVGFDSRIVEYQDNYSVTGEKLGRTIRSDGLQFPFSVEYLPETWAETEWPGLRDHCLGDDGLFVAPRPAQYPAECYFAWTQSRPRLERTYPNRIMSRTLSLDLRGYKKP